MTKPNTLKGYIGFNRLMKDMQKYAILPAEMQKLRDTLDEMNISWQDETTPPEMEIVIYRTKFDYNGNNYSVISGFGTYGGEHGLLELMLNDNCEEVHGFYTAQDILNIMKGETLYG